MQVWLSLDGFYKWDENKSVLDRVDSAHRSIDLFIQAYIVEQQHIDELLAYLSAIELTPSTVSSSSDIHDVFLGEFPWAPSCQEYRQTASGAGWTTDDDLPKPIIITTSNYLWEGNEYDCSIQKTVRGCVPSIWLMDNMHLSWSGRNLIFNDSTGQGRVMDPSANGGGPSVCLIQREFISSYLAEHGYTLLWIVSGSKQIYGNYDGGNSSGELLVSGIYQLNNGAVYGGLTITRRTRE